ncbi:DUF1559 domain-containing protein [Schlesneria paludicola]|uniref:DUF1559 domain-containing protein n=1 Tax=Schlesneria paludicola TaxID=360056 RepID=UPI0012FC1E9D|nr:DUF1559 domain-containing protein [Schlesneria paludicola]
MQKVAAESGSRSLSRRSGLTMIELLAVVVIMVLLISMLLPAVQQVRESARRNQCKSNLMQIGVALNNYMMTHRVLPSGSVNNSGPIKSVADGGYHMGWLVQILPFMEQQNTFRRFDFTKSVYDKANSDASGHMFPTLICPANLATLAGSSYRGVHHDFEAPIDMNQNGVLFLNSSIDEDQISDGFSHTAYVMETVGRWGGLLSWASGTRASLGNAVIRKLENTGVAGADEANVRYELHPGTVQVNDVSTLRNELANLEGQHELVGGPSSQHADVFNVVMGDGVARSVSKSIDAKVLRNMAHRADGELPSDRNE